LSQPYDPSLADQGQAPAGGQFAEWPNGSASGGQRDGRGAADQPGSDGPALPRITLPAGGGAIRGIDEKLTIGQPTGSASLSVPVQFSPGRQGFTPSLELRYDSGSGNGPFGLGWMLSVPSITRKTASGLPRYQDADDSDVFMLSSADDLVPALAQSGDGWVPDAFITTEGPASYAVRRYRPRVEAGFTRIERWQDTSTGDVHWRTVSTANVTSLFGQDAGSRIVDPADPARVFSWLLDFSYDDVGNATSYCYKPEDTSNVPSAAHEAGRSAGANRYLKRVCYGNDTPYQPSVTTQPPSQWDFQLVVDYGEHDQSAPTPEEVTTWPCRPDPFSTYRAGFEIRTYRTGQRFLMFHQFPVELGTDALLVRSTDLSYSAATTAAQADLPVYSFLGSITATGWFRPAGQASYQTEQLPPLTLGYAPFQLGDTECTADQDATQNVLGDVDGTRCRWVDLDGEGLPGLLTMDAKAWYYKRNVSAWNPAGPPAARLEPLRVVASRPAPPGLGQLELTSLNGDGKLAAVRYRPPLAGWYERQPPPAGLRAGAGTAVAATWPLDLAEAGWSPLRLFEPAASVNWASADLRLVDLDGDGLADVLITGDDVFTWYQWVPFEGFAGPCTVPRPFDEDIGPALVFADGTGSIYLADMSGDGLSDLVRIRNGEVCYWPNLGFGRFGAKITMDDAPLFDVEDQFDQRRLRLADIDGSGTTDLIYLGARTVRAYFNQSGNSWTCGQDLAETPQTDDVTTTDVIDLLGSGTGCLVWTSPLPGDTARPLRYIDLTSGSKPYLLTSIVNNLGAATTLSYAPSTSCYVQDELAGTPWVTRLPFPVQVVVRAAADELVSRTSLTSTYSYHHGYYDGIEREFRGFARVDQYDADLVPADSGVGQFTSTPPADPADTADFAIPPVWTRTWYHTGAWFDGADIATVLASEYYSLDPQAPQLDGTSLPPGLSAEEAREACRALRGRMLRQEVYADDGLPESVNPYTTTQYRYQVAMLQPTASAGGPPQPAQGPARGGPASPGYRYASYYASQLESLSAHYERNPADPRISHSLTLAVDQFGNVTNSATVGYPRRVPAFPEQQPTLLTYTENDVANVADETAWYRIGLAVETRVFQLTGVAPASGPLFDPASLLAGALAAAPIPYEATPSTTSPQKRLIKRNRTLYLGDDLTGPLPIGQVDSLGLTYAGYALTYTAGLLTDVYSAQLSGPALDAMLSGPGGFTDLDGDGNWWAPSARLFYSTDPGSPDPAFAAAHFYLPQGSIDPFGNVATLGYDSHDLLPVTATDAAGNVTTARHNYRVLAPWLLTDPNDNVSGVRFDPLGLVSATAVMGKVASDGSTEGDYLDLSSDEPSASDDPTAKLDYDLTAFQAWAGEPTSDPDHPAPAWSRLQTRVRHKDPATPWLEKYAYSDGLGRVAMVKAQAEAGLAPARDSSGNLVKAPNGTLVFQPTTTRWVGTGRVCLDNKGNPVKAYEPFFDSSPVFDDETDLVYWGVTAIGRYDPLSRLIRSDNPDGSYRTVEFDPWQMIASDENDTVAASAWYAARSAGQLGPDQADAAAKALADAATPTITNLDTLGRAFQVVADNGAAGRYPTTSTLDIEGQVLAVTDALGRQILTSDFSLAGTDIHHLSADGGERWLLTTADARRLASWDSRGTATTRAYDPLRRPLTVSVTMSGGQARTAEQVSYGEGLANAQALNLRGFVYQHRDEAGIAATNQRDFQGNVASASRQLLAAYSGDVDWSSEPAPALGADTFTTATTYDALNRPVTITTPDGSLTSPVFNERSLLAQVSATLAGSQPPVSYVSSVSYDPKGQRQLIAYGNGAITSYAYDPDTFRLIQLQTSRPSAGNPLQNLTYTYDPVGNVTRIGDAAQPTVYFANQVVTASADYSYDAIYRLVKATGREHIGQASAPQTDWNDAARISVPLPADGQAMRNYTEAYAYDQVGNITSVAHTAANGNWTRTYGYDGAASPPASNQLTSTTVGSQVASYSYDADGNLTTMPQLQFMAWDWRNQLQSTALVAPADATVPTTYYQYDATGQRLRKAANNPAGALASERIYLGGYEVYREYSPAGQLTLERQSLHVADGARLVCLVETTTVDAGAKAGTVPSAVTRYQFGNLLGSAVLELDPTAAILTYEEYYPYGSTSFQSGSSAAEVSLKRYRYTGRERDQETGLYYHGARYYAPWLGRWISCDPLGLADGPDLYVYGKDNPIRLADPTGTQAADTAPGPVVSSGLDISYPSPGAVTTYSAETNYEVPSITFTEPLDITIPPPKTKAPPKPPPKPVPKPPPPAPPQPAPEAPAPGGGGAGAGPAAPPAAGPPPATQAPPPSAFERFTDAFVSSLGEGFEAGLIGAAAIAFLPEIATAVAIVGVASLVVGAAELAAGSDLSGHAIDRASFAGHLGGGLVGSLLGGASFGALTADPVPLLDEPLNTGSGGPAAPPPSPGTTSGSAGSGAVPRPQFRIGEGVRRSVANRELGSPDVEAIDTVTRQPLGRIPLDQLLSTKSSIPRDPRFLNVLRGVGGGNPPGAPAVPPIEVTPLPPGADTGALTPVPMIRLLRWRSP
jgi:RHS repeat-associated protein